MIEELTMTKWNNYVVVLHVGCKGNSGGFKKKVEKEGKRGKLQKF